MKPQRFEERMDRINKVNELTKLIGDLGRRFFFHKGTYAQMVIDERGRLYWQDQYTNKRIYLHYRYWKRGFTNGGTLRHLVNMFKRYVMTGELLPQLFGPWPEEFCNGDLWGYGKENMKLIREKAQELGLLPVDEVPA